MKGIWISESIMNTDNTLLEKCCLAVISNYKKCYASNVTIAEKLKVEESTIANTISRLIKKGYLQKYKQGFKRILVITSLVSEEPISLDSEESSLMSEKDSLNSEKSSLYSEQSIKEYKGLQKEKKNPAAILDDEVDFNLIEEKKKKKVEKPAPVGKLFSVAYPTTDSFVLEMAEVAPKDIDFVRLYWAIRTWSENKLKKKDDRCLSLDWISVGMRWITENKNKWLLQEIQQFNPQNLPFF